MSFPRRFSPPFLPRNAAEMCGVSPSVFPSVRPSFFSSVRPVFFPLRSAAEIQNAAGCFPAVFPALRNGRKSPSVRSSLRRPNMHHSPPEHAPFAADLAPFAAGGFWNTPPSNIPPPSVRPFFPPSVRRFSLRPSAAANAAGTPLCRRNLAAVRPFAAVDVDPAAALRVDPAAAVVFAVRLPSICRPRTRAEPRLNPALPPEHGTPPLCPCRSCPSFSWTSRPSVLPPPPSMPVTPFLPPMFAPMLPPSVRSPPWTPWMPPMWCVFCRSMVFRFARSARSHRSRQPQGACQPLARLSLALLAVASLRRASVRVAPPPQGACQPLARLSLALPAATLLELRALSGLVWTFAHPPPPPVPPHPPLPFGGGGRFAALRRRSSR